MPNLSLYNMHGCLCLRYSIKTFSLVDTTTSAWEDNEKVGDGLQAESEHNVNQQRALGGYDAEEAAGWWMCIVNMYSTA